MIAATASICDVFTIVIISLFDFYLSLLKIAKNISL